MAKHYALLLFCFSLLLTFRCAAQTDVAIGCTVPRAESRSIDRLAHSLCDGLGSEREKANAIYNWVTHNIRYDVKSAMDGRLTRDDDAKRVLRKRKAVCEGYAHVFMDLCQAAGLQAVTVEGYARDWIFDNGDKLYVPRHEWNAVLIDGQWQLVDASWGAGGMAQAPGWLRRQLNRFSKNPVQTGKLRFVARYDSTYFLQDPGHFRLAHLPTDPIWQLTDTAMPVAVFEAGAAAINRFNGISRPAQQADLLGAAADYNEIIRTYEYADRAFAYNPRYYGPLAMREMLDAEVQIRFGDSINKYDPMPARYRYGKATRALGMSREYLKKQQEGYSIEARELKLKNGRKNDSAKKYVREIRTDNKRLTAQCKQKGRSSKTKAERIAQKKQRCTAS